MKVKSHHIRNPLFISIIFISLFFITNSAFTQQQRLEIRLGSSHKTIAAKLGLPIKEEVRSSFWGNKKSLAKIHISGR